MLAVAALAGGLAVAGGCAAVKWLAYVLTPVAETKTVEPEFAGLSGKTVAVVIFADDSIQYDYPLVRQELSMAIRGQILDHVERARVISVDRIIRYQNDRPGWAEAPKPELGKFFGADYILYVSLIEYSTREGGSVHLYRGRIKAETTLFDSARPADDCSVWKCPEVGVVYPAERAVASVGEDERVIRYEAQKRFADALAKKFYKHTIDGDVRPKVDE
jgi:hypothetical protein